MSLNIKENTKANDKKTNPYVYNELYYYVVDNNFRKKKVFFDTKFEQDEMKRREERMNEDQRKILNCILTSDEMKRRFLTPIAYELEEAHTYLRESEHNLNKEDLIMAVQCIFDSRTGENLHVYPLKSFVDACMIIKMYELKYKTEICTVESGYVVEELSKFDKSLNPIFVKCQKMKEEAREIFFNHRSEISEIVSSCLQPEVMKASMVSNTYMSEGITLENRIRDDVKNKTLGNVVLNVFIDNRSESIKVMRQMKGLSKDVDQKVDYYINECKKKENKDYLTCEHFLKNCKRCDLIDIGLGVNKFGNKIDKIHFQMFSRLQPVVMREMISNGFPRDVMRYCMEKMARGLRRYAILFKMYEGQYYMLCKCRYERKRRVRKRMAIASLGMIKSVLVSNDPERMHVVSREFEGNMYNHDREICFAEMMMRNSPDYDNGCDLYRYNIMGVYCQCRCEYRDWSQMINLGEAVRCGLDMFKPRFAQDSEEMIIIKVEQNHSDVSKFS